ncbi:unnamed protein product [Caenorhabditis angaria]|uniref:Nuclear Hormone Receptor family n=1 Tax=Caenorhabditis angaria TaxID=860376 RepID=A0A9P1N7H1_9PELO|nr:unnamed protein product [Caenorhabditis angaria]
MQSSSEDFVLCQICWQPAHGNHFGVFSCRACAAFFRRAIIGGLIRLPCRRGDGKCQASMDGRFACKKCRIDRCLQAGMNPHKLQHGRDLISSTENITKRKMITSKIPDSMEVFVGRPSFLLFCEPESSSPLKKIINVNHLIEHAFEIFTKNNTINVLKMNSLQKLSYGLEQSRKPKLEKPIILQKIGKEETLFFWEKEFLLVANWLTFCDEFQELPTNLKIEFLKSIWMIWIRLEKFATSIENRKNPENKNTQICQMTNDIEIDIFNVELDITWFTHYTMDQLAYFIDPAEHFFVESLIQPLMEFRPSIQEITYMLCLISFRHASKKQNGLEKFREKIMENLANDLHKYYVEDLQISNYAGRMAKMLRICREFEKDLNQRIEKSEIAKLFDIFYVDFSQPDMFCGLQ